MAKIIIDAGPLVALLNRKDSEHHWAEEETSKLEGPLFTCDAVLTEVAYLLPRRADLLARLGLLLEKQIIVSDFVSKDHVPHLTNLMATYHKVPMSFADAFIVCMVEDNAEATVLTLDSDFKIYRQHRRRVIPLIAPF